MHVVTHEEVQEALLDQVLSDQALSEKQGALSEAIEAHIEACEACQSFAAAVLELDDGLAGLAVFEAPAALVERTELALEALPRGESAARERTPEPGLFGVIFAGLFSGIWALLTLLVTPFRKSTWRSWAIVVPAVAALGLVFVGGAGVMSFQASERQVESAEASTDSLEDSVSMELADMGEPVSGIGGLAPNAPSAGDFWDDGVGDDVSQTRAQPMEGEAEFESAGQLTGRLDPPVDGDITVDGRFATLLPSSTDQGGEHNRDSLHEAAAAAPGLRQQLAALGYEADQRDEPPSEYIAREQGGTTGDTERGWDDERNQRRRGPVSNTSNSRGRDAPTTIDLPVVEPHGARADVAHSGWSGDDGRSDTDADGVLDEDDLCPSVAEIVVNGADDENGCPDPFRSPTGYWANTYVPGDPAIRALRRRLSDDPAAARLADLASPAAAGFEAPRTGALSLSVAADRAQVEGRTRVLMSVGIRGAAQRAGRRPALRTQVLLDLRRPLDEAGRGRVRALLSALSRRHDASDQVGLLVAGSDGGTRIELGSMRHGEVTVALRRVFGSPPDGATALGLRAALEQAVASVSQLHEDAPLGSSMVILVTPSLSEADGRELESVAHVGALAGVITTVVALGVEAPLAPLERLALAGQGRRRILDEARNADTLVRDEITAVSRVVARAVRLRIRLADGVQLVDVLGSRSLSEQQAVRVREAEQAVDRALAARLGIVSDRGDDEDGIQIVVPAFYADDTHHVLLDLVVPGPGPVADVQVRFKDLLRLGNGTLTDRLELTRGTAARGPRQRGVYAAGLGYQVASALRAAAAQLDAGRPEGARGVLESARARLDAATLDQPALASEPALARDVSLCRVYRDAIGVSDAGALSASLRFAAHRRLLGDPLGLSGEP